jgi:hypothetical protein
MGGVLVIMLSRVGLNIVVGIAASGAASPTSCSSPINVHSFVQCIEQASVLQTFEVEYEQVLQSLGSASCDSDVMGNLRQNQPPQATRYFIYTQPVVRWTQLIDGHHFLTTTICGTTHQSWYPFALFSVSTLIVVSPFRAFLTVLI